MNANIEIKQPTHTDPDILRNALVARLVRKILGQSTSGVIFTSHFGNIPAEHIHCKGAKCKEMEPVYRLTDTALKYPQEHLLLSESIRLLMSVESWRS